MDLEHDGMDLVMIKLELTEIEIEFIEKALATEILEIERNLGNISLGSIEGIQRAENLLRTRRTYVELSSRIREIKKGR